MIFLKIVILQLFWFLATTQSGHQFSFLFWPVGLILVFINYTLFISKITLLRYCVFIAFFSLWGVIQDGLLENTGAIFSDSNMVWLNSLWIVFLSYYGDIFNKINRLKVWQQSFLGGAAGVCTYWSGISLAQVELINQPLFVGIVFISWSIFFPLTLNLFYKNTFWNWFLDKTIYFSFDKSGFLRHKESFNSVNPNLEGKNILITGGTSGIGRSASETLESFGASIIFTGRNIDKGEKLTTFSKQFKQMDMSNWSSIKQFVEGCNSFDGIILNAGGMPSDKVFNDNGVESQAASQLFGHYYLIDLLRVHEKLNKGCRITWVSSGGMYLKELDVDELIDPKTYNKVDVYANVKRAQVTLVEELVKDNNWNDFSISTMHPGWVATDAVKSAIPGFYSFMQKRLRNPYEGADTIVWLQCTDETNLSGKFFFDRKEVSPYISKKYIPNNKTREKLLEILSSLSKGAWNV